MTTIVNNPALAVAPAADLGIKSLLIGGIVVIGFVMAFMYFGVPAIRRFGPNSVNLPATQVVIPDKINVNITQAK